MVSTHHPPFLRHPLPSPMLHRSVLFCSLSFLVLSFSPTYISSILFIDPICDPKISCYITYLAVSDVLLATFLPPICNEHSHSQTHIHTMVQRDAILNRCDCPQFVDVAWSEFIPRGGCAIVALPLEMFATDVQRPMTPFPSPNTHRAITDCRTRWPLPIFL